MQKVADIVPALSADAELKTFHLPPGYHAQLVASEPLVTDPIWVDFDADGRMYVLEMPGFAMDKTMADSREPIGRIAVLEDTNDDGRMDKRTVFMDGLVLPRALKVLANGVLVGEPPNLWFAKDTDGDLKADTKELVRNDYGRLEGNLEHNANSLWWALDNWIYTSEHDWYLRLKNGKFEVQKTLSRGQWGVGMDDAGRIYRNVNTEALFADIVPASYFMRNPNVVRTRGLYEDLVDPNKTAIWPVRPTRGVNRGYRDELLRPDGSAAYYTGVSSPMIYRGDRLPKELQGNAFVVDSPTNLVHRLVVEDDGSGRISARDAYRKGEFLASTDERFRPVNLFSAPDGTIYVVDMYRGVVQDVQFQTEYLKDYIVKHELELPVGNGRIWRVVHDSTRRDRKPALSKETPAGLVALLSHPNGWWRDTAQQLLVQRGDRSVVPALKQLALNAPDPRARLHALWTLDGLDAIDEDTVAQTLKHVSPDVRAASIRLSERWIGQPDDRLQAAVLQQMNNPNWTVRRQLAASLGALPEATAARDVDDAARPVRRRSDCCGRRDQRAEGSGSRRPERPARQQDRSEPDPRSDCDAGGGCHESRRQDRRAADHCRRCRSDAGRGAATRAASGARRGLERGGPEHGRSRRSHGRGCRRWSGRSWKCGRLWWSRPRRPDRRRPTLYGRANRADRADVRIR